MAETDILPPKELQGATVDKAVFAGANAHALTNSEVRLEVVMISIHHTWKFEWTCMGF